MSDQLQAVATILSWKESWYCLNRILAVLNSKSRCLGEEKPFCCCCWVPHIVAEKCHWVIYHRPSEPWLKSFLFGLCNVCARRFVCYSFQYGGRLCVGRVRGEIVSTILCYCTVLVQGHYFNWHRPDATYYALIYHINVATQLTTHICGAVAAQSDKQ